MIGLTVVRNESPDHVGQFAKENGMDWQMLVANQEFAQDYQVVSVPTTIFLDKNGNIVKVKDTNGQLVERFIGPRDYDTFKAAFDQIAGKETGSMSSL